MFYVDMSSVAEDPRQDEDLAIGLPPPSPISAVVAVAGRTSSRSVLLRQRSLSLDNDTTPKKSRVLFQKLRSGCSKLVRSTPTEIYDAGDGGHLQPPMPSGSELKKTSGGTIAAGFMGVAPSELKGLMSELRRSSDVVRAILWNLSFRDMYSNNNDSDMDSSNELDVDTLFDRHEQRRYADYEQEHGGLLPLLDSLSSLHSFQSLSSVGTGPDPTVPAAATSDSGVPTVIQHQSSLPPPPPPLPPPPPPPLLPALGSSSSWHPHPQLIVADNDTQTTAPKLIFKSTLSLDRINEMADVYTKQYLMTLPPLFIAVVRQNPTMIYLLLKAGASPNIQVSIILQYRNDFYIE